MTAIPRWLATVNRLTNWIYDHDLGRALGRRILRLTHVGRRSGRTLHTVLEVVGHDRVTGEFVVASGFGRRPDWLRNLDAGGPATVTVGSTTFPAGHRVLDADEAFTVFRDYERRNRTLAPVVRRALSGLLGWRYHGTDADRRRLVEQLPLVGLRPLPPRDPPTP